MRFPAPGAGSAGFAVTRVLVLVTPGSGRPVPTVMRSTVTTRSLARCFASLRLASSDRLRILNQDSRFSLFPRCIETAIAADVHAPFAQPTGIKRKSACNSSGSTPAEGLPAGELNGDGVADEQSPKSDAVGLSGFTTNRMRFSAPDADSAGFVTSRASSSPERPVLNVPSLL